MLDSNPQWAESRARGEKRSTFDNNFFVIFDGSKSKSVPEGKIEIDGRLLDTGKLQYSSHPEVAHWQNVLRERRKDRKLREKEDNTPTKVHIGSYGYEEGRKKVSTPHPPSQKIKVE